MFTRAFVLGVLLLIPSLALAAKWVPYTDGRVGGCFLSENGQLFGCTPQPQAHQPAYDSHSNSNSDDLASRAHTRQLEQENVQLKQEQENRALEMQEYENRSLEAQSRQRQSKSARDAIAEEKAYYDSQQGDKQRSIDVQRQTAWESGRSCSGAAYDAALKKMGLKRVPNVAGMCKSIYGSGGSTYTECPPCR